MKKIFILFLFLFFISSYCCASDTLKRYQTPIPPFDYNDIEVSFFNIADSALLCGNLTYPFSKGKYPAVVLVSGSGLQNRDEEIFRHKPFLVLADHLTKNGIVVLRYDDRGYAKSGKGKGEFTTFSNMRDAEAAIDFLKKQEFVDKNKIGVIGHSEGGTIAFILGAKNKDVNFIVSLAGSAVRGDTLLLSQSRALSKAMGIAQPIIELNAKINRNLYSMVTNSLRNDSVFLDSLSSGINRLYPNYSSSNKSAIIKQLSNPWLYEFIKLDPSIYIENVKVRVLALNGSKDLQVLSNLNLNAIKNGLDKGKNFNYKIMELDSLNHLFQHCQKGFPGEYEKIEETFSPKVLDILSAWILDN